MASKTLQANFVTPEQVAAGIKDGSTICTIGMTLVSASESNLKAIEKTLADALQARFAGTGPWRGPKGETNARLQAELQERWVPFVKREINKVDAAQALIDTPEEYARVAASCGGEIRKLTR